MYNSTLFFYTVDPINISWRGECFVSNEKKLLKHPKDNSNKVLLRAEESAEHTAMHTKNKTYLSVCYLSMD